MEFYTCGLLHISFLLQTTMSDVVVAPGGALGMSSFVSQVLCRLGFGIVAPRVLSCLIIL